MSATTVRERERGREREGGRERGGEGERKREGERKGKSFTLQKYEFVLAFYFKILCFINFISTLIHRIFYSFTSKNCNFFSLFLCIFPDF